MWCDTGALSEKRELARRKIGAIVMLALLSIPFAYCAGIVASGGLHLAGGFHRSDSKWILLK